MAFVGKIGQLEPITQKQTSSEQKWPIYGIIAIGIFLLLRENGGKKRR